MMKLREFIAGLDGAQERRQSSTGSTQFSDLAAPRSRQFSLHKDMPLGRAVQRYGTIAATPVMSWLHHRYAWI
jgi:hypothetical protein